MVPKPINIYVSQIKSKWLRRLAISATVIFGLLWCLIWPWVLGAIFAVISNYEWTKDFLKSAKDHW